MLGSSFFFFFFLNIFYSDFPMFSSYKYFPIIYLYLGRIIFVSQKIKKRLNYFSNFIILFPQKKKKTSFFYF